VKRPELKEACEEIEDEEDERIYHSKGWRSEFWIASVGMTAVSSFPEEDQGAPPAIGPARAQQELAAKLRK
jgi:hypothetical protein